MWPFSSTPVFISFPNMPGRTEEYELSIVALNTQSINISQYAYEHDCSCNGKTEITLTGTQLNTAR